MAIYGERNLQKKRSRLVNRRMRSAGILQSRSSYEDDGSDGVIRSARVRTNDGVYKRPVVNLAPVQSGNDVFAMENRAGDVAVELTNSKTKLNNASRFFQALMLE